MNKEKKNIYCYFTGGRGKGHKQNDQKNTLRMKSCTTEMWFLKS